MAFAPGFDPAEAKVLIALAAALEGPTPPLAMPLIPASWGGKPLFDSPVLGAFDNKWQLWHSGAPDQYAVVIRGTVGTAGSILEDVLAVMIPATGDIPVGTLKLSCRLAADPKAAVHLGFALGMAILLFDKDSGILAKLRQLVPASSDVFITGHSQGAAIATLCRSFLAYSDLLKDRGFDYKTYVFAQPKPGNDHYGCDLESIAGDLDRVFRVTNSQDWVPEVPLTLELPEDLNQPNPLDVLTGSAEFKVISSGLEFFHRHLAGVHVAKHLKQVQSLQKILAEQKLTAVSAATETLEARIRPTLNFTNCGSPISLRGTPGTNPDDPRDFFWQHHAAMYYNLLSETFG